ncbi:MAG TPA: FeS-binding protein, partial [Flexistipes sinusarabici]|nr:FeS-binding protein [Flexistipes sinusarabici]
GLPAIASGDGKDGRKTIHKNLKQMGNPADYDSYLVLCPSCGMAVKEEFPEHTADNPDLYKLSTEIAQKTLSLGMF